MPEVLSEGKVDSEERVMGVEESRFTLGKGNFTIGEGNLLLVKEVYCKKNFSAGRHSPPFYTKYIQLSII